VRIALRRGKEPLVADQPIRRAASAAGLRNCLRAVAAHVRAALLLGHAHADHHRNFLVERGVARIVLARIQLVAQRVEQSRLALQHGNAGEGHGQRT
jgi:hypothetical protein